MTDNTETPTTEPDPLGRLIWECLQHLCLPNGHAAMDADHIASEIRSSWLAVHDEAVRVEQRETDARIVRELYPLGAQVLGDAPDRIERAIRAGSTEGNTK